MNVLVLFYLLLIKHISLNLKKQQIDYLHYILNQILQVNFIFPQHLFKINNLNLLEMYFHQLIKIKQVNKELFYFIIKSSFLALLKPKIIIHRIDQKCLLDYLKTEESRSKSRTSSAIKTKSKSNTIVLRKRKSVSIIEIEKQKSRKRRKTKTNSTFISSKKFSLIIIFI